MQRQYSTMVYSALVSSVGFSTSFLGSSAVSCGDHGIRRHGKIRHFPGNCLVVTLTIQQKFFSKIAIKL